MMTHTPRWLALALVSCAACTYSFPDPKDTAQVYKCAGSEDCADGFSCVDQVCLEDAKFGTELVTIAGNVSQPAQLVYTSIQGVELSVPVINGTYELQVPVGDGSDVVVVRSRDSEADGREGIQLGSVLGDTARLSQLGGTARTVTPSELGAVVLTEYTTAALGAVCAAAGGSIPATRTALVDAEQNLALHYTEQQLVEAAAALLLVYQQAANTLPAGFTSTLDLACDPAAMLDFVAQWRGTSASADDPITTWASYFLANPPAGFGFRAASLPPSYFSALKSRNGFIGGGDERIVLGAGGTGVYQPPVVLSGDLPPVSTTTWSIMPDGGLKVLLDNGDLGRSSYMTASEIASYYSDATTRDAITSALGSRQYMIPYVLDRIEVRRLTEGLGADWVALTTHRTLRFAEALAPYGLVVSDVSVADPPTSRFFDRSDAFEYLPWPSALAGTTWATQLAFPADRPVFGEDDPTKLYASAALVAFRADGTAAVTNGLVPSGTSLTFAWTQAADGVVTLTYPDGLQKQRMVLWDSQPAAEGMLTWHEVGLATDLLGYGPARRYDLGAFSASSVQTVPGEYWQTGVNGAFYLPEAGNGVPRDFRFGFELKGDGTAIRRSMYQDTPTSPWVWSEELYFWHMEGSTVVLEQHMDQSTTYSSCAVGGNDPSCFVVRWRRWQPVSISADGKQLAVIEHDAWLVDRYNLVWDAAQGWTLDGTPFDVTNLPYFILPRVVTYSRLPIGD